MSRKIVIGVLIGALGFWACSADEPPQEVRSDGPAGSSSAAAVIDDRPVVLFLGTSLTAGYGLPQEFSFPSVIQAMLDSAGFALRVVNAGESGGTSAGGLRRIAWFLDQPLAILVLELGANDGLRGLGVDQMRDNLQGIIDKARAVHPGLALLVAGMEAPPNLGDRYTTRFRNVFRGLADENGGSIVPFLLEGVAAVPELNQGDGIHPTVEGHEVVARHVWQFLEPLARGVSSR